MKTDLSKVLSVSGVHGLYVYVAQARNGVIAEAMNGGKRTVLTMRNRISTLADIAIYTSEGEVSLKDVFLKMKETLAEEKAPTSKASQDEIQAFFGKALPTYDPDRFYVSHMKKVLDWYNELVEFASLDFVDEEAPEQETETQE